MKINYPGTPESNAGGPTLRLDQLEAISTIKREVSETGRSGRVLLGAGMGSGKTVISCEVIIKTGAKRVLIVGVRDAYSQWAKTLKEQGHTEPMLRLNKPENFNKLIDGEDGIFYAGLEMLRAQDWESRTETSYMDADIMAMFGSGPDTVGRTETFSTHLNTYKNMRAVDLLFSDEAHKHSNQKSNSIKTMETIPAKAIVALSGTFFGNKFINAWSVTGWLWGKDVVGTKTAFTKQWCTEVPVMSKDGKKRIRTASGFPLSKITGEKNPGEFVQSLPCYVFVATPVGDVPEPEIVKVELREEQQRQYDEMESKSLTWIPTEIIGSREPLVADLDLVQRIRLRTAALGAMTLIPGETEEDADKITFSPGCDSSVLDAAYKVLHRPTWVGQKVLILTHSKPFANEVARRIGQKYSVGLKTGGVSPAKWDDEKARFMMPVSETNSIQYLVAVISAVGTAMDGLQANCSKVLWLSEDENNTNNIQGGNRIWRDGVDIENYEAAKLVPSKTIAEGILKKNDSHRADVLDSVAGKG